jgi:matrixin
VLTRVASHRLTRVTRLRFSLGLGLLTAGLLGSTACYDSRWGQAKRAQQRAAADSKPADIAPEYGNGAADGGKRALRVRMRPNARYLAQTVDAPRQIADLVDDANRVLGPTLGLELEVDRVQPWSGDSDSPAAALSALRVDDPGKDADVVVGMIGALPRQTDSLHELGVATLLGKHLVIRAASRFDEHDSIDRAFSELSEDDRARIMSQRKRHRALAVFLHELGHSLGAVHELDAQSLMHPVYNPKMNGFGGGGIALMRVALAGGDHGAIARGQLELLRGAKSAEWVEADRAEEIADLDATLSPLPDKNAGVALGPPSGPDTPPDLPRNDADRFLKAAALFRAGAVAAAYAAGKPLFAGYPNVFAVQDLRCQLATVRWLEPAALRAECAASLRLSDTAEAGRDAGR